MSRLRHHILLHRRLAIFLVALALLMKMATPSGYMLSVTGDGIVASLCSGMAKPMPQAMPGMDHHSDDQVPDRTEAPCAFAGLSAPALAGGDAIPLVVAIAFIAVVAVRGAARPRPPDAAHLRPPLRGPPARHRAA